MAATALGNIPLSCGVYKDTEIDAALSGLASGVAEQIASAVSTVWKPGGSKVAADLTSSLLVAANEGYVYNLTTDATMTSDWLEGAGKTVLAGTDVAVVKSGSDYYFNALAPVDGTVVRGAKLNGTTNVNPEGGKLNFAAGNNISLAVSGGTANNVTVISVSGIADGAEVNQNAFSKIAVSGVSGTGDASSVTDTLTLVPGSNVTMTRDGKSVTINASVPSGIVYKVGGVEPDASGNVAVSGTCGISVYKYGDMLLVDGCGIQSGLSQVADIASGAAAAVCGLANFSQFTIKNASGTTCGTFTPASSADTSLFFKAGDNVTLAKSGSGVVISAIVPTISYPVTDGKISGGSSLLSGTTIVIPVASTSASGVTQLTNSVSNSTTTAITPNAVSGAISGVNSGLATKVTGSALHTALSGSGLANGTGSTNNTIYALVNALHSVDGTTES